MGVEVLNGENNPVIIREDLHERIHHGKMCFVSYVFTVTDEATAYVRHVCGNNNYLHSVLKAETVGEWTLTSYAGTTYEVDGEGTVIESINRRSDSTCEMETVFYRGPTIDVLGTPRLVETFGSGNNPAKVNTGSFSERLESVFAPNTDVLIGFYNNSGSEQKLSIRFDFYETDIHGL